RTFSVVVSDRLPPCAGFVHEALPIRSPLNAAGPEVTLKVALTDAPGATESNVIEVSVVPWTKEVHCLLGTVMLNFTPAARDPGVFGNDTGGSWLEPGVNVCSPGGVVAAAAGARLSRCTSYLAATTLACTCWSALSGGYPAVMTPS